MSAIGLGLKLGHSYVERSRLRLTDINSRGDHRGIIGLVEIKSVW